MIKKKLVICQNYRHFSKQLRSVMIFQNHYLNQILYVHPLWSQGEKLQTYWLTHNTLMWKRTEGFQVLQGLQGLYALQGKLSQKPAYGKIRPLLRRGIGQAGSTVCFVFICKSTIALM